VQEEDYYPFGLAFNSYSREHSLKQNYLFGGKEIQDELDLGWEDFHARQYNPSIGRFNSVDPASDIMRRYSPYNFAFDNPMRFIDPDGMTPAEVGEGSVTVDRKKYDKHGRQLKKISFRKAVRIETTVTIRNAKVVDKSGDNGGRTATKGEIKEAAQTMAKEIQDSWTGRSTDNKGRKVTTTVKFEGEIEVIKDEREAKSSEFVITINEDGGSKGLAHNGGALRGSNRMGVDFSYSYLNEIMLRNDSGEKGSIPLNSLGTRNESGARVASHEFGHNGGLPERRGPGGIMDLRLGGPLYRDRRDFFRGR
jgi:RHS repeat-associated protein